MRMQPVFRGERIAPLSVKGPALSLEAIGHLINHVGGHHHHWVVVDNCYGSLANVGQDDVTAASLFSLEAI